MDLMAKLQAYRPIFQAPNPRTSEPKLSPCPIPFTRTNAGMRRSTPAIHMKSSNIPVSKLDVARKHPSTAGVKDGHDVLGSFVGLLETTREELAEDLNTAVSSTEDTLQNRLDEMTAVYEKRADQFQADCKKTFAQIQAAVPQVPSGSLSAKSNVIGVSGIDRDAFVNTVDSENRSLNQLWAEWEKVQQKITYLAVEVLGIDGAGITKDPSKRAMKKRLNRATALFRKQLAGQEAMLGELQKQNQAITMMVANSVKQLKVRQKKCIDQRKKQREEVCQLAKKMMAHV